MTISPEEMEALTQPFALKDHKIREGAGKHKQQWLVYIDKIAVIKRLNAVFGGDWSNTIETRQLDGGVVAVDCHITIRGVTRGLNGADSKSFNPHDIAKSAGSDAVKRALTMWGVGLYLYDVPKIQTAGGYGIGKETNWNEKNKQEADAKRQFATWYHQQFGNDDSTPNVNSASPQRQTSKQSQPPAKNAQNSAQGETNGNLFDGMATLSRVVVSTHGKKKKLTCTTSAGTLTVFSRKQFIEAGWCHDDEWENDGDNANFNPPIHINVSKHTTKKGETFLKLDRIETNPFMEESN